MFTKIWQGFEKGNFAPVYLLVGEESYFVDETIKRLKTALSKDEETEVMTFDLNEQPIDFVIDEADTIPFFTERKLIIAKNASFLKATEKGKEKIEHDVKRLENWLANPSDTAITLFIAPYEKLDERKKVTKLMKEKSVLLRAETPQNNDLNAWIRSEAANNGKAINEDAIQKLIEMVGPNMLQHQMEIEKMALYLGEEPEISVELVEDLVAKTLEQDAFKMLNAYLNNKQEEALIIYHDLLRQKEEPIKLVGLLANNIRTMIQVYYLQKKGYHQQQIAKQLKVHPYRVQMVSSQRNRPTDQRLLQALYTLANVDLQLKTTGGNRERHLELFLMKQL
ncbi:MAG: DNA polymerase III subunit delta [Solibacillus sp.]